MISNELLKQKILYQAIHGRLVENDLSLEPIDVEESKEDIPFEIPNNWRWTKLGLIGSLKSGKTPKSCEVSSKGDIPYYKVSDMNVIGNEMFMNETKLYLKEKKYYLFPKNSIIFPKNGGALLTNKKRILTIESLVDLNTGVFIPNDDFYYKYIYYLFLTIDFNNYYKGTALPTLDNKKILDLNIAIPPLEEQKRIVDKIEDLFSLIDKKEHNDNKKEKLKILLKDKILYEAIHGSLVKNDLTLETIKAEEIKENIPFEIPNNWRWSKLKKVVEINPRNKIEDNIKVDFIEMSNIKAGYLNEYQFEEKQWKNVKSSFTHIKQDDVIIAKITPCFQNKKSVHLYNLPNKYGAATTELHVLRNTYNKMYMPYLLWFVKRNNFIEEGKNHFTGTAGQLRIPKKWLEDLKVPIPPLEEQKRIVEKIEKLFTLIDKL